MNYSLRRLAINYPQFVALSEDEYKEAKEANNSLIGILNIEEAYNILIETYVDFEQGLLDLALRKLAFQDYEAVSSIGEIHRLNLKLASFLTTVRLYMDQSPKNLVQLYKRSSGVLDQLKSVKEEERSSHFGFRVMEQLRNLIQHQGLPIFAMEYGRSLKNKRADKHIVLSVTPFINLHDLKNARGITTTLKAEIESKQNKTDLRPLMREYVESIGRIHKFIRELISQDVKRWRDILHTLSERYEAIDPGELTALGIVVTDDADNVVEKFHLNYRPDSRLIWLQQRNGVYNRFSICTVTNEL